jgi:hypothetical protein
MCVGVILLLGFVGSYSSAEAQTGGAGRDLDFQLHQNYPNPFNPVTRIPFDLLPALFERGQPVRVTIRIFSILRQQIAIPTALDHPMGNGARIENLEFAGPGEYEAYWDGLDKDGREVASGVYVVLLEVNGRKARPRNISVAK